MYVFFFFFWFAEGTGFQGYQIPSAFSKNFALLSCPAGNLQVTGALKLYWFLFFPSAYVELNRSAFLEPDGLPKARKSVFVSQKLTVSVGEVVNGGQLPSVPHHVPVSSFNEQNKYTGGSTTVDQASSSQKSDVEATGKSNHTVLDPAQEHTTG